MRKYVSQFRVYLQYERNYSAHTIDAYMSDLEQFANFLDAQKDSFDIHVIDADIVRRWMMEMMSDSVAASSVNRKLTALKSFFRFLMRKGVMTHNPLKMLTGPKKAKPLPYFVKEKDMADLLGDDETPTETDFEAVRDRLMLEVFYETGIRCSELVALKDDDVDSDGMLLKVTGKRNKQRLIPFAGRLKDMIGHYYNVRAREVGGGCRAFFVRKDGRPITSAIVYYKVKKNLSGITALGKRSPHVLRHTFATGMLNNDADLSAVSKILGHSSLASTQVYTHVTFEELKHNYNAHPRAQK
ncbi:MAG: tyrosine recombinase XerC [Tannerella sp.]|nr:tyrosine recombinase XerC [Tannerella sp.]